MNADYECPDNLRKENFPFANPRYRYYMSAYATRDRVVCALQGVKEATKRLCQKPNGKKKWWMTYVSGYGTFEFGISDHYTYWPTTSTHTQTSSDSYSSAWSWAARASEKQLEFTVGVICFKVRGVERIKISLFRHGVHTVVPVSAG